MLYDQFAQRWMVSQFAFNSTSQGPFYQCIAVSNSSDPTGSWCAYEFLVHQTKFNDYPKFGIWPAQNSYTMTAPQFNSTGGQGVWGFERDKMIACQTARFVYQDMVGLDPTLPRILPADADGPVAPPDGTPQPIVTDEDDGAGFPADRIVIWNATMTWGGSPSITLTHEGDLPVAAFDQDVGCGGGRTCIPQPGTSVKVDALPNRPMYRAAYRNYGSFQALAWDHTVDADAPSGNRAGVRWYELRKTSGNWGIQNQGTFGPSDGLYRWMGAAAMDRDGNLAVGYSIGNGTDAELPEHRVRRPAGGRPAQHARPGRGDDVQRVRLPDGHGEPLGRLLDDDDRPRRRLHVLVHDRVPPDDRSRPVADPDRELQVPDLRRAAATSASAAATAAAATSAASATATAATSAAASTSASTTSAAATAATSAATTATSAATTSAATTSASGPLPRPARPRAAPRSREDEDPAGALLGRQRPPRSLEALAARPRREPVTEARHDQAPELPGQAGRRPRLVIRHLSGRASCQSGDSELASRPQGGPGPGR